MKGLINFFVRRPVTVIMILAALLIIAVFSLFTLPVNRLPDISLPRVTVETVYPGMAAGEIRSMVTIPLEDGLSPVKGLERMRSVSRDNRSLISLDFRWGTDPMTAAVLVREAVDAVYPALPEGLGKPSVTAGDSANEAHAVIAVSSRNGNAAFARNLAEYEMRSRLRRIDGVGSVVLSGGEITEEKISLDAPRLAALGLTPSNFVNILAQETADIPAGNARDGNTELVITSSGKPESPAALSQIILPLAGGSLKIADIGEIRSSAAKKESVFIYNGKETAALEIFRRPGADPLRLSRDIKKTLDEASALFSRDAQIELVTDSAPSLISGIRGLLFSAALGAAAVMTVLFIFIRRLRYSLLASISIPAAAAAGICVLSAAGKSLNSMSLAGLAMGIGIVSDISVIVLDLLHRSFLDRKTVPGAEEIGNKAASIAGSSAASALTTALVFIPVIMLPGPLGGIFGDIAIALTVSAAAGWLYAQFCLPSLYRLFFNPAEASRKKIKNEKFNKIKNLFNGYFSVFTDGSLVRKYARHIDILLKKPKRIFLTAVFSVMAGFLMLLMRPMVFINSDDAEEVWISITSPTGTMLETIGITGRDISLLVSGLPSVKTVYGKAGAEEEDVLTRAAVDYKREELILRCVIKKGVKPEMALAEISAAVSGTVEYEKMPFEVFFPKDRTEVLLGLSSERTFVIKGKDREELLERAETAKEAFKSASAAVNFRPQGQRPELRLYPDREACAFLSIPAAQIAETLYILNEGVTASQLETEGRPLDVRVTADSSVFSDPIQRLEQTLIKTGEGKTVYLGSLGKIERQEAEASLARLDRADCLYADISFKTDLNSAVKKIAARFPWFSGADESVFSRYKTSLFLCVFLVLILLYMAMGAQFESFLLPLVLMISIPFSLAGAGPALLITGSKIDSGAVLGLTALFGLVVNNSLILFEISDQKIREGFSPADAVVYGARERFQAIIVTTATTVIALLPLVFSPMGNSQKSMAAAMLGGLAASALLSLYAVPPVLVRFFKQKIKSGEAE